MNYKQYKHDIKLYIFKITINQNSMYKIKNISQLTDLLLKNFLNYFISDFIS